MRPHRHLDDFTETTLQVDRYRDRGVWAMGVWRDAFTRTCTYSMHKTRRQRHLGAFTATYTTLALCYMRTHKHPPHRTCVHPTHHTAHIILHTILHTTSNNSTYSNRLQRKGGRHKDSVCLGVVLPPAPLPFAFVLVYLSGPLHETCALPVMHCALHLFVTALQPLV